MTDDECGTDTHHEVERHLKGWTLHLDEFFEKNRPVQDLNTRLERILHELWVQEFVWESIKVFAPIYDLICEMMSQCRLVFARHKEEWRNVMYEEPEVVEQATKGFGRMDQSVESREQ